MTMVVGKGVRGEQVYLLADTRITDPLRQANPSQGMLKIVILTPTLAVGFAGDPELAKRAVRKYRLRFGSASTDAEAVHHFRTLTQDNENDYLLAFAISSQLVRISEGRAQTYKKKAWVGDREAYDHFSRPKEGCFPQLPGSHHRMIAFGPDFPRSDAILGDLGRFAELVENPKFSGVGDFFTLAAVFQGRFSYGMVSSLYFDNSGILTPAGSTVMTAEGENREYRFSTGVPKDPTVSAVAFIFPQAGKCFLFHSQEHNFADTCTLINFISNLTAGEIAEEIRIKTGIDLHISLLHHA